jgi:protein-disulfide isomerase
MGRIFPFQCRVGRFAQMATKPLALIAALAMSAGLIVSVVNARAGQDSPVVAKVGNHEITEQEVDKLVKPRMASVENEIYELKRQAILSIADDYVIQQAAKRENLSEAEYLKKKIGDKLTPVSEQQAHAYYDAHQADIGQPFDKVKTALMRYLERKQLQERRDELLDTLREQAGFTMLLKPPRVEVATAGFPTLGPNDAPVTVVEFTDFQCPFCRRAEPTIKELRDKYGDKMRLVHRDFPLPFHRQAFKAAVAAHCAGDQGHFWQYHDALFADQSKLGNDEFKAIAKKLDLNMPQFQNCLDKDEHADQIKKDIAAGEALGVDGTPAFFINGVSLVGAQPPEKFESLINTELAQTKGASSPSQAQTNGKN